MGWGLLAPLPLVLVVLQGLVAAERPEVSRAEYKLRKLNVATLSVNNSVSWHTYKYAELQVTFNQPLYLASRFQGLPIHTRFNRSKIGQSLADSFALDCNWASYPIASTWRVGNQSGGKSWGDQFWTSPQPVLLPTYSHGNPYIEFMAAFDMDEDDAMSGYGANVVNLMIMMSHSTGKCQPQKFITEKMLRRCRLRYVPLDQRPQVQTPVDIESVNPSEILDSLPAKLSNFLGEELSFSTSLSLADDHSFEERSIARISSEDEWESFVERVDLPVDNRTLPLPASSIAFLQSSDKVKIVGKVLKPAIQAFLKPVMETSCDYIGNGAMGVFSNDMFNSVEVEVLPDLDTMLSEILLENLTNILVDSLTHTITKGLCAALTRAIGPYVSHAVADEITPILHAILVKVLDAKLPEKLDGFLPELLDRVLPLTLTHALTRSVTHSLVATLTHTITHHRKENEYCKTCFFEQKHCSFCHFSRVSMYYQNYHSAYYVDYFSDFYADYYANALQMTDAVLYPDFNGLEGGGKIGFAKAEIPPQG